MQSPLLQEFALYVGQELVFSDGEECLRKLGNIHIGLGCRQLRLSQY